MVPAVPKKQRPASRRGISSPLSVGRLPGTNTQGQEGITWKSCRKNHGFTMVLSSCGGFLRMFSLTFFNHVWDSRRFRKHRPLTWFDIQKLYQFVSLLPNIRKFNQESVDFWPGICMGFNVIQQIEKCSIKKQDVHSFEIWRWVNKCQ